MGKHARQKTPFDRIARLEQEVRRLKTKDLPSTSGGGAPVSFTCELEEGNVFEYYRGVHLACLSETDTYESIGGWTLEDPTGSGHKTALVPPGPGFYVWGFSADVKSTAVGDYPECYATIWDGDLTAGGGFPQFWWAHYGAINSKGNFPTDYTTAMEFNAAAHFASPMQKDLGAGDAEQFWALGAAIKTFDSTPLTEWGWFPRFYAYGWPDA